MGAELLGGLEGCRSYDLNFIDYCVADKKGNESMICKITFTMGKGVWKGKGAWNRKYYVTISIASAFWNMWLPSSIREEPQY